MALDTDIKAWETAGNIRYAISPPDDTRHERGNIYVAGSVGELMDFTFALARVVLPSDMDRAKFLRLYGSHFAKLQTAEFMREPLGSQDAEINISCERLYLRGSFGHDGQRVRSAPVLDYFNRSSVHNFTDMQERFRAALGKYKEES